MAADLAWVATARALLIQLGLTLADLQDDPMRRPEVSAVAQYLPQMTAAAGPGAARTYGPYWARMVTACWSQPLDTIVASDIEALQREITVSARSRHIAFARDQVVAAPAWMTATASHFRTATQSTKRI